MTDILIPLLDHSNKENLENFNNISSKFFEEYDIENKGYINIKTLEKSVNEIKNHFFRKSFGLVKLKILMSLFNKCDKKDSIKINKIIDNIIDININKIFELLSNNNKVILEDFKQIVVLLLLCLIDESIDSENKQENNILLLPFNDEDNDINDLLNLDSDSESVTLDELIETIINDILSNYNDEIVDVVELKDSILDFFENVIIENKKLDISDEDIEEFYIESNLKNEKFVKKIKIKHLLVNFITNILNKNDVL